MTRGPHMTPEEQTMARAHRTTPLLALTALALLAGLAAAPARAGQGCTQAKPTADTLSRSMGLAQRTAQALEADYRQHGTRVALLARMGQDLSAYQQRWSHVGWAYRAGEGRWLVVHKLNTCGTSQSQVMRQGLGEFFMDDLWRYEAAWMPAPPEWQARLLPLLNHDAAAVGLHEPRYSMLSYAWGQRYQQSNQWALETLAQTLEPAVRNRVQAQAWLQLKGYAPDALNIGPFTRLGGRLTRANVAFDDHPDDKRYADRIETVTADSMLRWLGAQWPGNPGALRELTLTSGPRL